MEPWKNSEYIILMGFNKKFLGTLSELQEEYLELGHVEFKRVYSKPDAFIGSISSINFLDKVFKNIKYMPTKIKKTK